MTYSLDEQLIITAYKGYHKKLENLIAQGADVNAVATRQLLDYKILKDESALMSAASCNRYRCLLVLLEHGVDIHYQTPGNKNTALAYACLRNIRYGSDYQCMRLLVEQGADINHRMNNGATPFKYFINISDSFLNFDYMKFMVEQGGNISDIDITKIRNPVIVEYLRSAQERQSLGVLIASSPASVLAQGDHELGF